MEQKIRIIIASLGGVLLISLFINFSTYTAKKTVERERDTLKTENTSLFKKTEEIAKDNRQLKEKITALNTDLDKFSKEREELQAKNEEFKKQYDLTLKEKNELLEKLKSFGPQETAEAGFSGADAYWAGILKAKTELSLLVENMRIELNTLKTRNEQLQRDLAKFSREKQDAEEKFSYNQKMFDNMAAELVIEKNARRRLIDILKPLKSENDTFREQLRSLSGRKTKLENKLIRLQSQKDDLERRFNEMALLLEQNVSQGLIQREQVEAIVSGVKTTTELPSTEKESVELPPIVVKPQPEPFAPTKETPIQTLSLWGIVLEVNEGENFLIIDLGEDSGIKIGDTFHVFREDADIATVEVVQVRKKIAACDIKKKTTSIKVGDIVK